MQPSPPAAESFVAAPANPPSNYEAMSAAYTSKRQAEPEEAGHEPGEPNKRRREEKDGKNGRGAKRRRVRGNPVQTISRTTTWTNYSLILVGCLQTHDVAQPVINRVLRPGLPHATHPSSFVVPDRPSPPLRPDDKVRGLG